MKRPANIMNEIINKEIQLNAQQTTSHLRNSWGIKENLNKF